MTCMTGSDRIKQDDITNIDRLVCAEAELNHPSFTSLMLGNLVGHGAPLLNDEPVGAVTDQRDGALLDCQIKSGLAVNRLRAVRINRDHIG